MVHRARLVARDEYVQVDNLTNRTYVGPVIVNETNSRFFEPAPGRTAYVMFSAGCAVPILRINGN